LHPIFTYFCLLMKLILHISFSFLFLAQAMGPGMDICCELLKIPTFIDHYQEQAQEDGTSLLEFIDVHYGDQQKSQDFHQDDEHDENLPFHGQHQCFHGNVYVTPSPNSVKLIAINFFDYTKKSPYQFLLGYELSESPFQPPKS